MPKYVINYCLLSLLLLILLSIWLFPRVSLYIDSVVVHGCGGSIEGFSKGENVGVNEMRKTLVLCPRCCKGGCKDHNRLEKIKYHGLDDTNYGPINFESDLWKVHERRVYESLDGNYETLPYNLVRVIGGRTIRETEPQHPGMSREDLDPTRGWSQRV